MAMEIWDGRPLTDREFIAAARHLSNMEEGSLEVDEPLPYGAVREGLVSKMVSRSDDVDEAGGVYVQAWVWVTVDEAKAHRKLVAKRGY
jgi:hypothetical protein